MLTITLSELMSDVQVAQMRPDGSMEESGEARRLRKSLEEVADESKCEMNLCECGLTSTTLNVVQEGFAENKWSWPEVKRLSQCLILALDAGLEHALLVSILSSDLLANFFFFSTCVNYRLSYLMRMKCILLFLKCFKKY